MKKKLLVTLLALSLAAGSLAPVSPLDNTAVVAEAAKKKPKKKTYHKHNCHMEIAIHFSFSFPDPINYKYCQQENATESQHKKNFIDTLKSSRPPRKPTAHRFPISCYIRISSSPYLYFFCIIICHTFGNLKINIK